MTGQSLLELLIALSPAERELPVVSEDLETYVNELTDLEPEDGRLNLTFGMRAEPLAQGARPRGAAGKDS